MGTVSDCINNRIKTLDLLISRLQETIAKRAPGELVIHVQRGKKRYYQLKEGKRHYLGRNESSLITDLAQKQYEQIILSAAIREKEVLQKCLDLISSAIEQGLDSIAESIDPDIVKCIVPDISTDDGFARAWAKEDFTQQEKTEKHRYETLSKDLVRSKSEALIADRLFNAGIPFRYEQQLLLGNRFAMHCYYPDFTILNKRTRQVFIWEHLGMMGDRDYCSDNLNKLEVYAEYGILTGKNLILTFEGGDKPLSTSYVNKMIEAYLK